MFTLSRREAKLCNPTAVTGAGLHGVDGNLFLRMRRSRSALGTSFTHAGCLAQKGVGLVA